MPAAGGAPAHLHQQLGQLQLSAWLGLVATWQALPLGIHAAMPLQFGCAAEIFDRLLPSQTRR
jgi:hypothetical protein